MLPFQKASSDSNFVTGIGNAAVPAKKMRISREGHAFHLLDPYVVGVVGRIEAGKEHACNVAATQVRAWVMRDRGVDEEKYKHG